MAIVPPAKPDQTAALAKEAAAILDGQRGKVHVREQWAAMGLYASCLARLHGWVDDSPGINEDKPRG